MFHVPDPTVNGVLVQLPRDCFCGSSTWAVPVAGADVEGEVPVAGAEVVVEPAAVVVDEEGSEVLVPAEALVPVVVPVVEPDGGGGV